MTNVTTKETRARFKNLPTALQDALFSVQTAEIIARVIEQNHVPKEKAGGVAEATGLVILGFIHPEEVSREIADRTGLDKQVAQALASSLSARIFDALKSDLDRIYAPALHDHEREPIKVTEIQMPGKFVKLDTLQIENLEKPKEKTVFKKPDEVRAPLVPSGAPAQPPPPTAPARSTPVPPPVILHQESSIAPIKPVGQFGVRVNELASRKTEERPPLRAARLELGGNTPAPVPPPRQIPKPIPQVSQSIGPKEVHYSEFKTPLPKEPKLETIPVPTTPAKPLASPKPAPSPSPAIPQAPRINLPPLKPATTPFLKVTAPPPLPAVPSGPPRPPQPPTKIPPTFSVPPKPPEPKTLPSLQSIPISELKKAVPEAMKKETPGALPPIPPPPPPPAAPSLKSALPVPPKPVEEVINLNTLKKFPRPSAP